MSDRLVNTHAEAERRQFAAQFVASLLPSLIELGITEENTTGMIEGCLEAAEKLQEMLDKTSLEKR